MTLIVVGDGIAGCTVALALRRHGSPVTLVGGIEERGAATPASAGMVAPQYESEPTAPTFALGVASRARYPRFLARLRELSPGDVRLVPGGMLVANLDVTQHDMAVTASLAHRREGLDADVIDGKAARAIEPAVAPEVESFLWLPDEMRLDARLLATTLRRAVGAADVRRVTARVVDVLHGNGAVSGVRLAEGDIVRGARVVVAAGAWSGEIGGLPHPLPLRPVRGQMLRLASAELPAGPVLADHSGRYLVPTKGGALAGSTMEDAGFTAEVTESGLRSIRDAVGRLCPGAAQAPAADRWCGFRPVSDDGAPIIGPDPEISGLLYATGYGRSGVLLAPLLAEAVAELALGGEPDISWGGLSIGRFRNAESGLRPRAGADNAR